jgi:hypothetical protein
MLEQLPLSRHSRHYTCARALLLEQLSNMEVCVHMVCTRTLQALCGLAGKACYAALPKL